MEYYLRPSHTVYDLKYHLVWITKYSKPILKGEIAVRLRELIREICKSKDVENIKGRYTGITATFSYRFRHTFR